MITPYDRQFRALEIANNNRSYALCWDCGLGKTLAGAMIMQADDSGRWLVSAPAQALHGWVKACNLLGLRAGALTSNPNFGAEYYHNIPWIGKQKSISAVQKIIEECADIVLCSHETLAKFKADKRFNRFILDEAHRFNGAASGTATQLQKTGFALAKRAGRLYTMTATPTRNTVLDLWAQNELLRPGTWGNKSVFFNSYGRPIKMERAGWPVIIGWSVAKTIQAEITEKFREVSWFLTQDEVLDLPPLTSSELHYTISGDALKRYNEYMKYYTELTAGNVNKQLQCASGAIYTAGGVEDVHSAKMDLLIDAIRGIKGKVIVWVAYNHEKTRIASALQLDGIDWNMQSEWTKWVNSDVKVLIAHPGSLGTGVDGLQAVCHNVIWYGPTYSYVDYYQSLGRIQRDGQQHPMVEIRLTSNQTTDCKAWKAIDNKQDLLTALRSGL